VGLCGNLGLSEEQLNHHITMKTLTRKSLIASLKKAHTATEANESEKRWLIEAFIDDLSEGFDNIHAAAKTLRENGIAI
jgi:hypothetical protein